MSDDEAFIRAIVANPGDDAPRLIYADWLEERDDPRGMFLRVANAFERANPTGTSKAALKAFNTEWKRIDPVWAARVSRPPLGICCETLSITHCSTPIQLTDFVRIEADLQANLPPQYKAFLLNHNGGIPEPKWFSLSARPVPELAVRFYPATEETPAVEKGSRYYGNIFQATEGLYGGPHPPPPPRRLIPIMAASFPVSILIGVVGVRAGCIYRQYEPHLEGDMMLGGPEKIADNLATFLSGFRRRQ